MDPLDQKISVLERELQRRNTECAELMHSLKQSQSEVTQLHSELANIRENSGNEQAHYKHLQKENNELRTQLRCEVRRRIEHQVDGEGHHFSPMRCSPQGGDVGVVGKSSSISSIGFSSGKQKNQNKAARVTMVVEDEEVEALMDRTRDVVAVEENVLRLEREEDDNLEQRFIALMKK